MSAFERIDPQHPLAVAAREVNSAADLLGGPEAFYFLQLGCSVKQAFYLGEQRVISAIAAREGHVMGRNAFEDELKAKMIVRREDWPAMLRLLLPIWIDGMATGWQGHRVSERRLEPDELTVDEI